LLLRLALRTRELTAQKSGSSRNENIHRFLLR
jgi:hypothetical protein